MLNEAELIESENTLRKLRVDSEVLETRRSIARWLALTLGIINPGESRQSAIAVLDALIYFQFVKQADPNVEQLKEYIAENWEGINEKTLRYHLLRMKKMGFIENSQGRVYFSMPPKGDRFDPANVFGALLEKNNREITERIALVISELKKKSIIGGEINEK
ncbi:MAG: hypothetical protein ACP5T4_03365 [Candidatus Micrarchaeia archaeon]